MFCRSVLFNTDIAIAKWVEGITPQVTNEEKRSISMFPDWKWKKSYLRRYPKDFDAWFNDHMGWRIKLVNGYGYIQRDLLHTHNLVLKGKEGWLLRLTFDYHQPKYH